MVEAEAYCGQIDCSTRMGQVGRHTKAPPSRSRRTGRRTLQRPPAPDAKTKKLKTVLTNKDHDDLAFSFVL
ncbi:hypothetical protein EVAR_99799_1 [Eumeta japonica]|uniref:Uncharacterized protein n=1 Tax=Eumeta variegata TaxID=151549 RepID=A0A4C1ZGD7_EUMVA|nr:hypothetical protein EVAR_99799_1 [Eumeta japonica]